jgi:hypothetical protein
MKVVAGVIEKVKIGDYNFRADYTKFTWNDRELKLILEIGLQIIKR